MKWIGLTGGIATGKSTVTKLLREKGYLVVDADEISKQVLGKGSPEYETVIQHFGKQYLLPDGSLDRKKIGDRIFSNVEDKKFLESIVHPKVQQQVSEIKKQAQQNGKQIAFYDVPLLFEKKMNDQFDQIILVSADEETQLSRMQKRDGFILDQAKVRLKNQLPMHLKKTQATYVIDNNSNFEDLKKQLDQVLKSILT